jgi:hypothetical protein
LESGGVGILDKRAVILFMNRINRSIEPMYDVPGAMFKFCRNHHNGMNGIAAIHETDF